MTFDKSYTLPTPTREYYGFNGWYDADGNKWVDGIYSVDSNISLTARWTPDSYTITYVLNNGTNNPSNPSNYTVEDNIVLLDASRTGYSFQGWFNESHNKVDTIPLGSHGNITLTAEWQINVYNYSFVNYDGSELQSGSAEYGSSVTYTGATPIKPANAQYTYTFSGWDKDTSFIKNDTIFTAQFNSTISKYTITWENWDGTVLDIEIVEYGTTPSYKGTEPTKPSDEIHAYVFSGWTPTIAEVTGDATYVATYSTESLYQYFLTSGKASISGVMDSGLSIYNIPSTINGYPVVEIRTNAFKKCSIAEEIIVPNSVNFIQKGAFSGCSSLKTITLPFVGCQRIDASAITGTQAQADYLFGYVFGDIEFENSTLVTTSSINYYLPSGLTSVTINNTGETTIIPAYGFEYNKILTNVNIEGNISGLAFHALEFCKSLVSFDCSNSQVSTIKNSVFDDCVSLKSVTLGTKVTYIGESAFADCGLEEFTIPDSVETIGAGAFRGCYYLKKMTMPFVGLVKPNSEEATYTNVLFGAIFSATGSTVTPGEGESIICQKAKNPGAANPASAYFKVPASLTEITITGSTLGYGALSGTIFETINLSENITNIPDYCFYNCNALTKINLEQVKYLGDFSFNTCKVLEDVYLNSVITIGQYAFSKCYGLERLVLGAPLEYIFTGAFGGTTFTVVYSLGVNPSRVEESGGGGYRNLMSMLVSYSESGPNGWHYVDGVPTLW